MSGQFDPVGEITVVAQPNNIEGVEKRLRLPPPKLGEHSDEVLRSLSFTDGEIGRLRARHIV